MKKILIFLLCIVQTMSSLATVKIQESDGSPSGTADIIKVNNGSLTLSGNTATVDSTTGNAPNTAHYLTSQAESGLSAEVNLGALTTGLLKHTVSGGVSTPATATAGTDYYNPGGTDVAVADGGTNKSSWTQYAIPYLSASTTFSEIAIGSAGQVLKVNGGATGYTWSADDVGSSSGISTVKEDGVTVTTGATVLNFTHGLDVTETPSGTVNIAVDETELSITGLLSNPPDWACDNCQINTSISSNNLVVALKSVAGNDPDSTSTNKVNVRIANTMRTVTGALSVTATNGTSYFNAGATELATKDVDYFCYLIWNTNTSAVAIGVARVPYGTLVSDFSTTSTAETFLLVNGTAPASTDSVTLIGRFNAINSGTASYNWSISGSLIINHPIYETRWLTWVPTLSVSSGTAPTYTLAFVNRYKMSYRVMQVEIRWQNTSGGTAGSGANSLVTTLPFAVNSNIYGQNRFGFGFGESLNSATANFRLWVCDATASSFNMQDTASAALTGNGQNNATRYVFGEGYYEI